MNTNSLLYFKNSWEWFREKSQTKTAEIWLGTYSFFESVILPFPTDVFLILMVLADRKRAARLVLITTLSAVFGAVVLYAMVILFYALLLEPLIVFFDLTESIAHASQAVQEYTFVATFVGAFTPIPYTPVIVAAGLLRADFIAFVLASLVGRGLRYSLVAAATLIFGASVLPRIKKYASLVTFLSLALVVVVFFFVWNGLR